MAELRIVSFFPAATEMVAALGMEEFLIGTSAECNWPPEIRSRPIVVRQILKTDEMPPAELDSEISRRVGNGESLYELDEELLAELAPTHILTQDLCHVCAPSGRELDQALELLPHKPVVVNMTAGTLTGIAQSLRRLGEALGPRAEAEAETLLIEWKARVDDVQERVRHRPRVRCFVMEWVDPIYCSGHWIAEMVQIAGGYDLLARPGQDSVRVSWDEVRAAAPDVLVIAPCGYNLDQASDQLAHLKTLPGWEELPAVQSKRVYAVNADAFVTRPGPRLVDGIEMLAYLFHGSP